MFDFSDREMMISKLNELNERNIPAMSLDKLVSLSGYSYLKSDIESATEEEIQKCNEHLANYCEAGYNDGNDIFSDEKCYFYWGLAHGNMVTNDNGMNRQYYHYLTLGGKRHKVELLLQNHPSVYSIKEE